MRIDDKFKYDLNKLNETSDKKKTSKSSSDTSSSSDSVSLSSSAQDVAATTEAVKSSSDVRIELVQELKEKIESGQYNVSGRDVADKIVQTAINDLF